MKNYIIEIKWAIISISVLLVWMFLEKQAGLHDEYINRQADYTLFYFIPAFLVYFFALLDKRKNFYGGKLSYADGFRSGLVLTLIVTLLTPEAQLLISNVITPEYTPNIIKYSVEKGLMSQEQATENFSISNYMFQATATAFIFGLICSALIPLVLKREHATAVSKENHQEI